MAVEEEALSRRLRLARERSGLTQAQLAATAGVAVNTVKQYESGRIKPGADALAGYARAGINLRYLLLGEGEPLEGAGYPPATVRVRLQLEEDATASYGEVPVAGIVEAMLAIASSIDRCQTRAEVELTETKRSAVAQALFEEYLESGAVPRPATVLRFIQAAR